MALELLKRILNRVVLVKRLGFVRLVLLDLVLLIRCVMSCLR